MISYLMGMRGYAVDKYGKFQVDDNGNKVNVVDEEVNTSSQLIRLFLTMLYNHDASMGVEKHTWLSHYNFLCLLNLPEQIKMLGPLRNRYEGGVRGEGFLREVKPMISSTARKNWRRNLLSNLMKHKSVLLVQSSREEKKPSDRNSLDLSCVKVYGSLAEFTEDWGNGLPISIVVDSQTCTEGKLEYPYMCAVVKQNVQRCLLQIAPCDVEDEPDFSFGLWYFRFKHSLELIDAQETHHDVRCCAVLLPWLNDPDDADVISHAIVLDEWKVFDNECNIVFPHACVDMTKSKWEA